MRPPSAMTPARYQRSHCSHRATDRPTGDGIVYNKNNIPGQSQPKNLRTSHTYG
ncbi:hypothetical protein FrEUN1fDRAFT_5126 [Parafrankia sp. EUN1f]|nr:hypothetical protein FrEUN1fDRAFT_5126 [Parafrankia sp. EUN1f]